MQGSGATNRCSSHHVSVSIVCKVKMELPALIPIARAVISTRPGVSGNFARKYAPQVNLAGLGCLRDGHIGNPRIPSFSAVEDASVSSKRAFNLRAQHNLKGRNVFIVHKRVMASSHIDVSICSTRKVIPPLELIVQPVILRAAQRLSVEHGY